MAVLNNVHRLTSGGGSSPLRQGTTYLRKRRQPNWEFALKPGTRVSDVAGELLARLENDPHPNHDKAAKVAASFIFNELKTSPTRSRYRSEKHFLQLCQEIADLDTKSTTQYGVKQAKKMLKYFK